MESIKELRKICQDKGYKEHPTLRLYRLFSIYITKIFLILRIKKPVIISLVGFLFGAVGGYFYLVGNFILGSILFFLFMVLDHVDGEVARYCKLVSVFGGWLDTTTGHLLYPYFFFTLGLGIYFQTGTLYCIILGSIAAMAKLIERSEYRPLAGADKSDALFKSQNIISAKGWLSHIGKNVILHPVVLLCSIVGWEIYFLWFFAIYLVLLAFGKVLLTGWRIYKREQ